MPASPEDIKKLLLTRKATRHNLAYQGFVALQSCHANVFVISAINFDLDIERELLLAYSDEIYNYICQRGYQVLKFENFRPQWRRLTIKLGFTREGNTYRRGHCH